MDHDEQVKEAVLRNLTRALPFAMFKQLLSVKASPPPGLCPSLLEWISKTEDDISDHLYQELDADGQTPSSTSTASRPVRGTAVVFSTEEIPPGAKRPMTAVDNEERPRDPDYYIQDGNICLAVGRRHFRDPSRHACRHRSQHV